MDKDKDNRVKIKDNYKKQDEVTEAGLESFPASDPPASWASAPEPVEESDNESEPDSDKKQEKAEQ